MNDTRKQCAYEKCEEMPLSYSKEGFCIFHEPEKTEEDCKRFGELVNEKCKKIDFNFIGYVFPKEFEFKTKKFIEAANFIDTTFQGNADFDKATFQEKAIFWRATFQGIATFIDTTFQGNAGFVDTTFQGGAGFVGATFQGDVKFWGVIFKKESWVYNVKFKKGDFGEFFYRAAKTGSRNIGQYRQEGDYHRFEMDAIRKQQKWFKRGWNFIFQKFLHGYGERPFNVAGFALFIILFFSVMFSVFGIEEQGNPALVHHYWTCLYYSVVTFTTLGYGDFHPIGGTRILAAAEALMGVFLMALFVVTFARRWRR